MTKLTNGARGGTVTFFQPLLRSYLYGFRRNVRHLAPLKHKIIDLKQGLELISRLEPGKIKKTSSDVLDRIVERENCDKFFW